MKPMFLPGVEANPEPGPYAGAIAAMRQSGAEYPQIWHLFAFKPAATAHLAKFTQEVMHGEAPLSSGLRELIAAFVSARNDCPFWLKSHAAVAAELLGSQELVEQVLADFESSALSPKEKALFRLVEKVNRDSPRMMADDMAPLYEHGWSDEQIYYAITVCALFNFYNRWIDATGVHALSDEAHRAGGKRTAANGYVRK